MVNSVRRRVSEVFKDSPASDGKDYAVLLLSAWKDLAGLLAKQVTLLLLVMAIFELLAYQKPSSEITVGALTVSNSAALLMALPPVVAYLAYDIFCLLGRVNDIAEAYNTVFQVLWPRQAEEDLQRLVIPVVSGVLRTSSFTSFRSQLRSERFLSWLNLTIGAGATQLFPIVFQVQAYYILFGRFGFANAFLWITALVSFGFTVSVFVYMRLAGADLTDQQDMASEQDQAGEQPS